MNDAIMNVDIMNGDIMNGDIMNGDIMNGDIMNGINMNGNIMDEPKQIHTRNSTNLEASAMKITFRGNTSVFIIFHGLKPGQ